MEGLGPDWKISLRYFRQFGPRAPTSNKILRSLYWALRGCQYWLCFYDDEVEVDVEDLLSNPFNTQPPSLDRLQQLTGFDKKWLMFMYRNFKQDLVVCLWELTEGARCSEYHLPSHPDVSIRAAFVFAMMSPDSKGRVSAAAFHDYVRSIFTLCGSNQDVDASAALGLPPGSINRRVRLDCRSVSILLIGHSYANFQMTVSELRPLAPHIKRFAVDRFHVSFF
ncbi:hypothetical protein ANCCEY_10966 [Ancylostoma ceylanicum]|uniref:EF-hand domain-containing protein n=1 Tax=Ancylostoma ceylanicum TaxID=53326 RepID=A0A0D6LCY4_9BILA|nr:hypothetical protein ANCCEY_10966 [Ancylostoma ceylanicum]